jgi:hypothetical protein
MTIQAVLEKAVKEFVYPVALATQDDIDWIVTPILEVLEDYLKQTRLELQQPEYNPSTYQGSYAMLGKEQMLDQLTADLRNNPVEEQKSK